MFDGATDILCLPSVRCSESLTWDQKTKDTQEALKKSQIMLFLIGHTLHRRSSTKMKSQTSSSKSQFYYCTRLKLLEIFFIPDCQIEWPVSHSFQPGEETSTTRTVGREQQRWTCGSEEVLKHPSSAIEFWPGFSGFFRLHVHFETICTRCMICE